MFRQFIRSLSLSSKSFRKSIRPPVPVFGVEGRYVTALYSAASQKNELDSAEKGLREVLKSLCKPGISDFIDTSMLSRNAKAKILQDIGKEVGLPSTAANFLAIVAENGRLKLLRDMIVLFLEVMVAHRKEAHCEVITAEPLSSSDKEELMKALKKFVKGEKKITLTEKIDESIIGGVIVGIEDAHIDLSISRRLQYYTDIMEKSV